MFEEKVHEILAKHNASDPSRPLFLFYAPHIVHAPAQVPRGAYEQRNDASEKGKRARSKVKRVANHGCVKLA